MRRDKSTESVNCFEQDSKRLRTSNTKSSSTMVLPRLQHHQEPTLAVTSAINSGEKFTTQDLHKILNASKHNSSPAAFDSDSSGEFVDLRKYLDRNDKRNKSLPPKSRGWSRSGSFPNTQEEPLPPATAPGESRQLLHTPIITYRRASKQFNSEKSPETVAEISRSPTNDDHNYAAKSSHGPHNSIDTIATAEYGYETDFSEPQKRKSGFRKPKLFRSSSFRSLRKMITGKFRSGSSYNIANTTPAHNPRPNEPYAGALGGSDGTTRTNGTVAETWSVIDLPPSSCRSTTMTNGYQSDVDTTSCLSVPVSGSARTPSKSNSLKPDLPTYLTDLGTPALRGIRNHGNTCYINAVMQCLSNTDQLAEYFVTDRYTYDLNSTLQRRNRKSSSNAEVTHAAAKLIRSLWFDCYTKGVSESFKRTIERYSEQYLGSQQQDCQEFCIWLLDRIHQDLNLATKRKFKPLKQNSSKPESQLAQETLDSHLIRDKSIVTDLFQAQFRSCTRCPDCNVPGLAFDPYMCVSLPVPQKRSRKPLFVVVIFLNRDPRLLCLGLNADITATFGEVGDCLCVEAKIPQSQLIICELTSVGFYRTFRRGQLVTTLGQSDTVYAFETPPPLQPAANQISSAGVPVSQDELVLLVVNRVGAGSPVRSGSRETRSSVVQIRFGGPVAVRVNRELFYSDICGAIISSMQNQFLPHVDIKDIPLDAFRLRLEDPYVSHTYLPTTVEMPLFVESVDSVLSAQTSEFGPPHLKIIVEWDANSKAKYFKYPEEMVMEHVSASDLRNEVNPPERQTLNDCLKEYTSSEQLDWSCHTCKGKLKRAERTITFWSLPDILVIHLKRFKYMLSGEQIKVDANVQFPVENLDMTPYLYNADGESSTASNSPYKKRGAQQAGSANSLQREKNNQLLGGAASSAFGANTYDLFAVCNHHGETIHSGHYTAYCKNPIDQQWYSFDDEKVSRIVPEKIVTNAAYLLFYERKTSQHIYQIRNSVESGFSDHWAHRLVVNRFQGCSQETLEGTETEDEAIASSSQASSNVEQNGAVGQPLRPGTRGKQAAPVSESLPPVSLRNCSVVIEPITPELIRKSKVVVAGDIMTSSGTNALIKDLLTDWHPQSEGSQQINGYRTNDNAQEARKAGGKPALLPKPAVKPPVKPRSQSSRAQAISPQGGQDVVNNPPMAKTKIKTQSIMETDL